MVAVDLAGQVVGKGTSEAGAAFASLDVASALGVAGGAYRVAGLDNGVASTTALRHAVLADVRGSVLASQDVPVVSGSLVRAVPLPGDVRLLAGDEADWFPWGYWPRAGCHLYGAFAKHSVDLARLSGICAMPISCALSGSLIADLGNCWWGLSFVCYW